MALLRYLRAPSTKAMKADLGFSILPSFLPQSTMVVLHALSEYLARQPPGPDQSLNVDLRITGRREIRYHFNPQTAYMARSSRVREAYSFILRPRRSD